jgi:hypothetical protein
MKTKRYLSILVVLTITTSALAVAGTQGAYPSISKYLFPSEASVQVQQGLVPSPEKPVSPARPDISRSGDAKSTEEVPDTVIYFVLFKNLVGLKEQSEKFAARGESLDYLKIYRDDASLSNSESELLFQTGQDCIDALTPIDAEAKRVITAARGTGEIKNPADLPPPPKELIDLQRQKDEAILRFRDTLKSRLGDEKFAEFDRFARKKIAPNVTREINEKEVK